MRNKKLFSALLALALVLSIAAVAFAAEKSEAAPAAAHSCSGELFERDYYLYAYKSTTQHTYHRQTVQFCNTCQMTVDQDTSLSTYSHSYTTTELGNYEESGETVTCYFKECACGDIKLTTG